MTTMDNGKRNFLIKAGKVAAVVTGGGLAGYGFAGLLNMGDDMTNSKLKTQRPREALKKSEEQEKKYDSYMLQLRDIAIDASHGADDKYEISGPGPDHTFLENTFDRFEKFFKIFWSEEKMIKSYEFANLGMGGTGSSLPLQMLRSGNHIFYLKLSNAIEELDFILNNKMHKDMQSYFYHYLRNKVEMGLSHSVTSIFKGLPKPLAAPQNDDDIGTREI